MFISLLESWSSEFKTELTEKESKTEPVECTTGVKSWKEQEDREVRCVEHFLLKAYNEKDCLRFYEDIKKLEKTTQGPSTWM